MRVDGEEKTVFIDYDKMKPQVLFIEDIESKLNEYEGYYLRYTQEIIRSEKLQMRVTKLRKELDKSKERESDGEAIKAVCSIIQSRIDFCAHEPIMGAVSEHMKRIKEELQKENLWRI